MQTPARFLMFVVIVFLTLCVACGGGGGGSDIITPFTINNAIATGDLNGDGEFDLALVTTYIAGPPPHPGHVAVYLQDPANPGTFFSAVNYTVGSDPWHIAIADLNSDGKLDIVVANTNSNDVSVLLHDTTYSDSFRAAINYTSGSYTNFVAIGDLNGDGRPDIAAAINEGVCILFQHPVNTGAFLPAIRLSLPSGTSSVAIGDLNRDGRPDLVATTSDNIYVFTQDPTLPGIFLSAATYAAGPRASSVVIHDIDSDGLADMVVVNAGDSSSGGNSRISIYFQDQGNPGQFHDATNYPSANGSRSVAVSDFNGDGRPDLAVAAIVYSSQSPGVVQVFIQDSASPGKFLLPQSYGAGYTPQSIASRDLNGDGKLDLVSNDGPMILIQKPAQPGKFADGLIIPVH